MSWREFFVTTICNIFPFLKKYSNKRWYSLNIAPQWFILDDPEDEITNESLREIGFSVLDYRRKK